MPSKTELQIAGPWDATAMQSVPELAPGMVHLWHTRLSPSANEPEACKELLSSEENDRALRFRVEQPRNDFVVTRGTLRFLLARYLGCSPQDVRFSYGVHGKPVLKGNSNLCFNVSHAHGLALVAFTKERAMGG